MVKILRNMFYIFTIVLFLSSMFTGVAFATKPEKVTICHAAGQEGTDKFLELTIGWEAVYGNAGHFYENGTPRAGHEDDYLGACLGDPTELPTETVTLPPTDEPTVTPTLEVTEPPVDTATPTLEVTEPPVDTVTPTLEVTEPPADTVTPTLEVTEPPVDTVTGTPTVTLETEVNEVVELIPLIPLTGADNSGNSKTLFNFGLGSLGMALALTGVEKKLVLDKN